MRKLKERVLFRDSSLRLAVCPFITLKLKYKRCNPDETGKYPYTDSLECALKTLKAGGPLKFYTEFPVYCVRIAPHVMLEQKSLDFIGGKLTEVFLVDDNGQPVTTVEERLGCKRELFDSVAIQLLLWMLKMVTNGIDQCELLLKLYLPFLGPIVLPQRGELHPYRPITL
ncbi:hypothetical protein IFM89_018429 [Coptis chinensis]|uniref:Uncharacterized protein n=1 Tax=Coptis chinensis TaxID=261450 RepID=A0A835HWQ8_9MAGN|nr:hypothetical protein IFM89_018429 [Coptis chinensis]